MKKFYHIKNKSFNKILLSILLTTVFMLLIFIGIGFLKGEEYFDIIAMLKFFSFFVLAFFVVSIIRPLNYYYFNRKDKLVLDTDKSVGVFYHGKKEIEFRFDDIAEIVSVRGSDFLEEYVFPVCWQNQGYSIFKLNSGKYFILSYILFDKQNLLIFADKIKVKYKFWRSGFLLKHRI